VLHPEPVPTPEGLQAVIARQGVDTLFITTALFNAVIDLAPEAFKPVKQLLTGGEAHSVGHMQKARALLTDTCVSNVYGPTESTTFTTHYPLDALMDAPLRSIPIGRPISNTQVYVLDAHFKPVPIGVVGELYIGGDGLARGYLNRPELTAERFIPNPLPGTPGERLYKTGDLVRYLADGNIEFMGRTDDQVKIRGFRIELGEIEATLRQHPQVQDCLVMVRDEGAAGKRLVAYVVNAQAPEDFAATLRGHLKETLPEYMLPSAFLTLDAFPLTPNGKVDRKALSAMTLAASAETAYVAPRTPIEEELARIWCELLQLERVGVHDNFFELGGHSLLGTQMMSRIHSALQARLPLRTLFEHPTVAGLSLEVINLKTEKTASQAIEDLLSELEEITDEEALTKAKTRQSDTNTQ
jgi:acyl-coenzyme A synthetase/AMP-(fatty) acid ligase